MGIFELVSRGITGRDTTWVRWYYKLCVSLDTQSDTKPILNNYFDQQQQHCIGKVINDTSSDPPAAHAAVASRPGSRQLAGCSR